jgi:hypothetical protein
MCRRAIDQSPAGVVVDRASGWIAELVACALERVVDGADADAEAGGDLAVRVVAGRQGDGAASSADSESRRSISARSCSRAGVTATGSSSRRPAARATAGRRASVGVSAGSMLVRVHSREQGLVRI